jgi:threonine/homoserine/homoserine lactone efflux protein
MPEWHTLLLFSVAVLGLLITPGPSMAFLLAHSLASGRRGGLAVATGILLSDLVMSALTALGLAALMAASPRALETVRWTGAIYLLWLAWQSLRRGDVRLAAAERKPFAVIARQSLLNSLLNPKAFLFFVLFLPQFVQPAADHVTLQLGVLGAWLGAEAWLFHAGLGMISGSAARGLSGPRASRVLSGIQAAVFLGLALRLLLG